MSRVIPGDTPSVNQQDAQHMDLERFRELIDSISSLCKRVKEFPDEAPQLIDILSTNKTEFQRIIRDRVDFHKTGAAFPNHRDMLVDILLEDSTSFQRVVQEGWDMAAIAKQCPARAQALLNILLTNEEEFNRIIKNGYDLAEVKTAFSEHADILREKMFTEFNLETFKKIINNSFELHQFAGAFPEYQSQLIGILLTHKTEFQRMRYNCYDFERTLKIFSEHAVALVDILLEDPESFKLAVPHAHALASIATACPERAEALLNVILTDLTEFNRVIKWDWPSLQDLQQAFPNHPISQQPSSKASMQYAIESAHSHDRLKLLLQQINALSDSDPTSPSSARSMIVAQFKKEVSDCLNKSAPMATLYSTIAEKWEKFNKLDPLVREINSLNHHAAPSSLYSLAISKLQQYILNRVKEPRSLSDLYSIIYDIYHTFEKNIDLFTALDSLHDSDPTALRRALIVKCKQELLDCMDKTLDWNISLCQEEFSKVDQLLININALHDDPNPSSARGVMIAQFKKAVVEHVNSSSSLRDIGNHISHDQLAMEKVEEILKKANAFHHPDASSYRTTILGHFKIKINELAKTPRPGLEKKLEMLSARKNHFEQFDRITQEFLAIIMKYKGSNPERLKQIEAIKDAVVTAYLNSYDDYDHLSEDLGQTLFSLQTKIMAIREQVLQDHKAKGHGRLFGKSQSESTLVQLIDRALLEQPLLSLQIALNNVIAQPTRENIRLLFREFSFGDIDPKYADSLGHVLSQEAVWPTIPLSKKDIKEIKITKSALIACITDIKDHQQRQSALWQALLPNTLLGAVFHIAQDRVTPSLSTSKNKRKIVAALIANISDHDFLLEHGPTRDALYDNVSLQKEIQKTYPELYSQLAANRLIKRESSVVVQSDLFKHAEVGAINDVDNFDEGKSKGFGLGMITDDDL